MVYYVKNVKIEFKINGNSRHDTYFFSLEICVNFNALL